MFPTVCTDIIALRRVKSKYENPTAFCENPTFYRYCIDKSAFTFYTFGRTKIRTGGKYGDVSVSVGLSARKGTVIPPHFHDYYELVCYYGGKGHSDYRPADKMPYKRGEFLTFYERPFSSNGSFRFDDNSIILYKPYTIHNEVHEKDCNFIAFGFTLNRDVKLDNAIFHSPSHEISDTIAAIRRECNEKKNNFELAADGLIDVLLCQLTRLDSASAKSATSPLHYVKIYLDNYYMTDVTVTELAAMAGFSPDHFAGCLSANTASRPKSICCGCGSAKRKNCSPIPTCPFWLSPRKSGFWTSASSRGFIKNDTASRPLRRGNNPPRRKKYRIRKDDPPDRTRESFF